MYTIKCNPDFNYQDIVKIFNSELELSVSTTPDSLPETILEILMGTRQIREGSKPSIEYQYRVIQQIKTAIEQQIPISVVIPSGPKKPGLNGDFIDLAEYWFARILKQLILHVEGVYTPGIKFHILLEDASMAIFEPEVPHVIAYNYYTLWIDLVRVLEMEDKIIPVLESSIVSAKDLKNTSTEIFEAILTYITAMEKMDRSVAVEALQEMKDIGWNGGLSLTTLDYYYKSFSGNYPHDPKSMIQERIALYLATSYARYKLKARKVTDNDIPIAVAKRVPGVDFALYDRIFYRTVPLSKTKTHIPFWRARGVINESNGGEFETKLFPFNAAPNVIENLVTLMNGDNWVELYIDIIV